MAACQSFNQSENGTCTLFSDPRRDARSKYQFKKNRCESANTQIMEGDSFVVRSQGKNLYLDASPFKSGWKKKRATHWQFDAELETMRLNGSTSCLAFEKISSFSDLAEFKEFQVCQLLSGQVSSKGYFQRFSMSFNSSVCKWSFKTKMGRHVKIPDNFTTKVNIAESQRLTPVSNKPPPLSFYFAERNLSSFEAIEEDHVCARFDVSNGSLLPTQYEAPIFFPGQVLTIACNEKYILKREKKEIVTWKCEIGETVPKYKCVSMRGPNYAYIFMLVLAAVAIGVPVYCTIRNSLCGTCTCRKSEPSSEGRLEMTSKPASAEARNRRDSANPVQPT